MGEHRYFQSFHMDQRPNFPAFQRKEGLEVGGNPQTWHKSQDPHLHPGPWHHTRPILLSRSLACGALASHSHPSSTVSAQELLIALLAAQAARALGSSLEQPTALKGLPEGGEREEDDRPRSYSFKEKKMMRPREESRENQREDCAPKIVT